MNYLESISPSSVCLNFSGIITTLFSCVLASIECAVLLIFLNTWLKVAVPVSVFVLFSCEPRDFLFLADPVTFLFFICLAYSDSLALDSCCEGLGVGFLFSFDSSNVY